MQNLIVEKKRVDWGKSCLYYSSLILFIFMPFQYLFRIYSLSNLHEVVYTDLYSVVSGALIQIVKYKFYKFDCIV